ncbi:MAG: LysR family transcriptional regulator [Clostridia bacterium]
MKESDWVILDTLYRYPNITKASSVLFMTQSSLTKRLQKIESNFNTAIATRNPKGITFTPQGEYLARKASELLAQFKEIQQQVMKMDDGSIGTIKMCTTNSFGRFTLPSLLQKYKTLHPKVDFDIISGLSSDAVRMVRNEELYIGFIRGYHKFEGIKHLMSVDQCYIVSKKEIELDELPYIPRIEYVLDISTIKFLDKWWYDNFTVPPLKGMTVNHGDTCREMIANGFGYGVFLVPEFIDSTNDLFKMPMRTNDNKFLTRKTWMICNSDSYKIPLVKNFVDFIKDTVCL